MRIVAFRRRIMRPASAVSCSVWHTSYASINAQLVIQARRFLVSSQLVDCWSLMFVKFISRDLVRGDAGITQCTVLFFHFNSPHLTASRRTMFCWMVVLCFQFTIVEKSLEGGWEVLEVLRSFRTACGVSILWIQLPPLAEVTLDHLSKASSQAGVIVKVVSEWKHSHALVPQASVKPKKRFNCCGM